MSGLFGSSNTINNEATKIGALRLQQATQGVPVPITFGTTRVTPNLLDYVDFTAIPHTETQETGGKGGGGTTVSNTTYTYTVGLILGLGEGPYNFVDRTWKNKDSTNITELSMSLYEGSDIQTPWSYMVTTHPSRALAYRNEAYLATQALDLGNSDSLPNMSFEVGALGASDILSCAPDANPAIVMTGLLTSPQYGIGFPALGNLSVFQNFCNASNLLVSPSYREQKPASDRIAELAKIGNSGIVWSEGQLKIIPYGDANVSHQPFFFNGCSCVLGATYTYTPDLTPQYSLTYDDFIGQPPVKVKRKRPADAFNTVQVTCLDRANDYNKATVEAKDAAMIARYGMRAAPVINADLICDLDIARNVAQAALQRELYFRNTYSFTIGWKYFRLEPMDIVAITDPLLGLVALPVRIKRISEDENGKLAIEAEDVFAGVATPGTYGTQTSEGFQVNNTVSPGNTFTPVIFQPPVELSGVPQIWIGASGGSNWGGCEVWASDDGSSYAKVGIITAPARYGDLTANWPASSDPDTTGNLSVNMSTSNGTLVTATSAQADGGDTLSYVGTAVAGEIIAYSTVTSNAPSQYTMSGYIRRGLRCSFAGPHITGEKFMRLDGAIAKIAAQQSRVGNTVYVKLLSYNKYGNALQGLSEVSAIPYVVQPLGIVAVNGVIPSTIQATQVLCIPDGTQYSVASRFTCLGRTNCDGRLVVT